MSLVLALAPGVARGDTPLAVIVSDRWEGVDQISLAELRQLYLGRRTRLEGQRVRCLHLPAGNPARNAFTRAVVGRSERAMERYWLRQALSGGPPPPQELEASQVLAWLAAEPGRIGYLAWTDREPPAGLRVLRIVVDGRGRRPADAEYPLRVPDEPPAS